MKFSRHFFNFIVGVSVTIFIPVSAFAKTINVLTINDFHGYVTEYGPNPGMAKFVTAVKKEKNRYTNSIVVFAGDDYQGGTLSRLSHGEIVNAMMREIGVVASAVGDHEFAWGVKYIPRWEQEGRFTFLAANIYDAKTNRPVKWARPFLIVKKDGFKIAFIGLTTRETSFKMPPEVVKGYIFKDPAKIAQKWINYLRAGKAKEGKPDAIIALTHMASFQNRETGRIFGAKDLIELCHDKGLDAVVSAHSHKLISGVVGRVPVVQAGNDGRAVGRLELVVNKNNYLLRVVPHLDLLGEGVAKRRPDVIAQQIYNRYLALLPAKYFKVIGKASINLIHSNNKTGASTFDTWLCDITRKKTQTQICFMNGGTVRGDLLKGAIKRLYLSFLLPFPNKLVSFKLRGKDIYKIVSAHLLTNLQYSGIKVCFEKRSLLKKKNLKIFLLNGKPVEMNKIYTVSANRFMLDGGDKYNLVNAKDIKIFNFDIYDLAMKAVEAQHTIVPV